jgi:hypothetical protein
MPHHPKAPGAHGRGRHLAAALVLFWLALVYLNYYPQFYARFLP